MAKYEPRRILEIGAELGEHPIWSSQEQCLYWLDIENHRINRFDPASATNTAWTLPVAPGCFAFREDGTAVIAAQDGFYDMNFTTGSIELVMPAKHDPEKLRFNDGRTDRQGRLWVSTVSENLDLSNTDAHGWFRLDENGLEEMLFSVGIPNGTAFSPDGKTMYRARTMEREIFAYDYEVSTGRISNERIFATVPFELGGPDGAAVDSEGGYWVALAAPQDGSSPTGGVARFSADGVLDRYIEMSVPMVTMIAFGGPDLSTLYVTTARLEKFMLAGVPPHAGDLFAIETDYRGEPETPFKVF